MNSLLPLLILAALPLTSNDARHPDAVEVYHCDFGEASDTNFDLWPDHWVRQRGSEFPAYLKISIDENTAAVGKRCLRMDLDGGAAAIYGPPIDVSPQFSYVLEGYLKTEQLVHDVAYFSVTFYDADNKRLETKESARFSDVFQWRKIRIGPMIPSHSETRRAVIGLHLKPTNQADLTGAALFDDIWLARLPRVTLHSNSQHNVYTQIGEVEITCKVSGVLQRDPQITFELIDETSQRLATKQHRLEASIIAQKSSRVSVLLDEAESQREFNKTGFAGTAKWKPPIDDYGFYRVQMTMQGSTGLIHRRSITLAVIRPYPKPTGGEFGWSLPSGDDPLSMSDLAGLLEQVGINWVKYPVWYSENDTEQADRLARFAERLNVQGIEMIGMLDQPPPDVRELFGESGQLPAAAIYNEPELWQPILNPVLTRLSLKVRWWQLGTDDDTSFVGYPDLVERIGQVKAQLERFGQHIQLGVGWRWLNEQPNLESRPWEFLNFNADPPLTPEELAIHLQDKSENSAQRWVVLKPLRQGDYNVATRSRDLVMRMLAAKIHGAEAVFIPQPFSSDYGLLNDDGTPGELLLPWRTTALHLSGARHLGSIVMPSGSKNYIFTRGDQAIMVIWNETTTEEKLFIGDDIKMIDLWGRTQEPERDGEAHLIPVGPRPKFITGVNPQIAQWRINFAFDRARLSSAFGRSQDVGYHLRNTFHQGVGGVMTLQTPPVWDVEPRSLRFKLAEEEDLHDSYNVVLRADASSGEHMVRVDFDMTADRNYKFSAYRRLVVGLGDVTLDVNTRKGEAGELIVDQHLINKNDKFINFDCLLFVPNRRRMRQQVLNLGRGRHTTTYVIANAEELRGKSLWLRAEELGGERILNKRVTVEP